MSERDKIGKLVLKMCLTKMLGTLILICGVALAQLSLLYFVLLKVFTT